MNIIAQYVQKFLSESLPSLSRDFEKVATALKSSEGVEFVFDATLSGETEGHLDSRGDYESGREIVEDAEGSFVIERNDSEWDWQLFWTGEYLEVSEKGSSLSAEEAVLAIKKIASEFDEFELGEQI